MKNEKFNKILHNALQVQKEMEKREKLYKESEMSDLISRQAAIDAADDMVEPQESEDKE